MKRLIKVKGFIKRVSQIMLAMAIAISPLLMVSTPTKKVQAYQTGSNSYVTVDELWGRDQNQPEDHTVSQSNLQDLFNYLVGKNNATYDEVLALAQSGDQTASDIRGKTYGKTSSQGVVVTLGGLKWQVVYLTTNKSGTAPIATLYLADSYQQAFEDNEASYSKGDYFGFKDGVMYSDWAANWYSAWDETTTPSAMYGRSYINAVTLNNGGYYWYSSNGQNDSDAEVAVATANQDANSAFAKFTMSNVSGSVTSILTTPSQVAYQQYQAAHLELEDWEDLPNDAYGYGQALTIDSNYSATNGYEMIQGDEDDCDYSEGNPRANNNGYYDWWDLHKVDSHGNEYVFYAGGEDEGGYWDDVRDYNGISGYDSWKNSYLWLPSATETGFYQDNEGIWELSIAERGSLDGNWEDVSGVKNSSNSDLENVYTPCWLRSGNRYGASYAYGLNPSGNDFSVYRVDYSCAVRPSLHLNLKSAAIYGGLTTTVFPNTGVSGAISAVIVIAISVIMIIMLISYTMISKQPKKIIK